MLKRPNIQLNDTAAVETHQIPTFTSTPPQSDDDDSTGMEAYYQSIINGGYEDPFYEEPQGARARSTQDVAARHNTAGTSEHAGIGENDGMGEDRGRYEDRNEGYGRRREGMGGATYEDRGGYRPINEAMGRYEGGGLGRYEGGGLGRYEGEDEGSGGYEGGDEDMDGGESGKYYNHDEYGIAGNFDWGGQHGTFNDNGQNGQSKAHGLPAGQEAGQRSHTHVCLCLPSNSPFYNNMLGRDTVLSTHAMNMSQMCRKGLVPFR